MPVTNDLTDRDPVDLIAEEYADRCRRGDRPSVDEYVLRYPEHEQELREILPAVGFLEVGRVELSRSKTAEGVFSVQRFGEQRVVKEIGRGGMGIVYEAVQEPLGRRVAVKVLPRPSAADPRSRERFLREARAVARLRHPHIVPIHGVGEAENVPYYVMALIEGVGLDQIKDAPSSVFARSKWVAGLGIQAAEALAHAHGHGILHRDVKPANLLLEPNGHLWLTDFGLAKLADDLSLTETGGLPGTLRYLAPECLDGDGDVRSDVYGLGLTLYELLLGRPAFGESNRLRLLKQVRDSDPPAPRTILPNVPRDLETILLKATARSPHRRYASAAEFADDLRRFIEGRPIQARRVRAPERLASFIGRNPLVAALSTATVALSLVSVHFVRLWYLAPPFHEDEPPPTAKKEADPKSGGEGEPTLDFPRDPAPPVPSEFRGPRPPRRDGAPFGPEGEFAGPGRRRPRIDGPPREPGPEMKGLRPEDRPRRPFPPPDGRRPGGREFGPGGPPFPPEARPRPRPDPEY